MKSAILGYFLQIPILATVSRVSLLDLSCSKVTFSCWIITSFNDFYDVICLETIVYCIEMKALNWLSDDDSTSSSGLPNQRTVFR